MGGGVEEWRGNYPGSGSGLLYGSMFFLGIQIKFHEADVDKFGIMNKSRNICHLYITALCWGYWWVYGSKYLVLDRMPDFATDVRFVDRAQFAPYTYLPVFHFHSLAVCLFPFHSFDMSISSSDIDNTESNLRNAHELHAGQKKPHLLVLSNFDIWYHTRATLISDPFLLQHPPCDVAEWVVIKGPVLLHSGMNHLQLRRVGVPHHSVIGRSGHQSLLSSEISFRANECL